MLYGCQKILSVHTFVILWTVYYGWIWKYVSHIKSNFLTWNRIQLLDIRPKAEGQNLNNIDNEFYQDYPILTWKNGLPLKENDHKERHDKSIKVQWIKSRNYLKLPSLGKLINHVHIYYFVAQRVPEIYARFLFFCNFL